MPDTDIQIHNSLGCFFLLSNIFYLFCLFEVLQTSIYLIFAIQMRFRDDL
jgi:hypothetical protein